MSSSRLKISFQEPLRDVRLTNGFEVLISEKAVRESFAEKFHAGFEAGQKELREQLIEQRKQLLDL